MTKRKGVEYGSLFIFMLLIGLIMAIFYNYITTPNVNPVPLLVVILWFVIHFFRNFGEYLGRMNILRKNFITMGGCIGVYLFHRVYDSGKVEYFFITMKRYADFVGFEEFQEKSAVQRFFLRFTNSRMVSIVDDPEMFFDVPEYMKDCQEGAIVYYGTFKKGVKVLSPFQAFKVMLEQYASIIKEIETIVEKARAVSEQNSQEQGKNIVESVLKLGTAIQNLPIGNKIITNPQQQGG